MKRVAVLVSGRGSNLAAVIAARDRGTLPDTELACVVSNVADAGALAIAASAGISSTVIRHQDFRTRATFDAALVERLHGIDYVLLAGFMRLLSPVMVGAFKNRILNVHPSLLPAFPGAHAVRDAIAYGAKLTGVSVHFVDEGTDTGPVILQRSLAIEDTDTEESLHARIQKIEHQLVPETLALACAGRLRVDGRRVRVG